MSPKPRRTTRARPAPSSSGDASPSTPEAVAATTPDAASAADRADGAPPGSTPSPAAGAPVLRPAVTSVAGMRGTTSAVPAHDPSEPPTSLQPTAAIAMTGNAPPEHEIVPCPNCGRARAGQFRYCLSCGFDYDVAVRASSVRPWLIDIPRDQQLHPTGARKLIRTIPVREPEPPPPAPPPAPAPERPPVIVGSAGIPERTSVGAGRFTLTRGMVIAGAIAVGVAAAIIVTLLAVVLTRLYGSS